MSAIESFETASESEGLLWKSRMQGRIQKLMACVIPVLVAAISVLNETQLSAWVGRHEAVLPLAVIVLLLSLLSQRLRSQLILTLCYGVAFMAVRDIGRVGSQPLPQAINYDFLDECRPAILLLIAGLSTTAALMETFNPGTVWARRCYFGAAALYFIGLGIIHVGRYGSWKAVLLCVTGVTAIFGCIFANRIVSAETEEEDAISDDAVQGLTEAAHRRSLLAKEWHEKEWHELVAGDPPTPETNPSGTSARPAASSTDGSLWRAAP